MTTSPRQSGVRLVKGPSVMGKARTSVGPFTPRYVRFKAAMPASSTSTTLHSAVGRPSARNVAPPTFFSHAVSTGTFRCRFRRLIAILDSSLGALVRSAAGVLDALMEEAGQDPHEAVGDDVEIPQCQVALVELRIHEDRVDDLLHHPANARWRRVGERARGRLHGVRQ